MNHKMTAHILGLVLLIEAALMLLPLVTSIIYGESILAFAVSMAVTGLAGFALFCVKPDNHRLFARDGLVCVGLAWIAMSLFGALPFVISGEIPSCVDALFETVSGFTTTGATILNDIESMSRGCLFWRSFTHWIGGMGVLVFVMAVLPMNGEHSMHIMRAEVPGPTVGKLVPRVRKTAMILYLIYTGLTVIETVLLMLGGMSFFDALLHAFATAGTGGFSTRNASIAAFNSAYIETVIAAFLVLFGMNFNLFYLALIGKLREALRSEELHWYLGIIAASTLAMAAGISNMYGGFATALRHGFFNTLTIMSTAGFGTVDFTTWPQYTQAIIVLLMFIGGCAGSTGGGLKLSRVILLGKTAKAEAEQVLRPRMVKRIGMDGKIVEDRTIRAVYTFTALYIIILLACMMVLFTDGGDLVTNFTAALSCISNVGPGLGKVGPSYNYSGFSDVPKLVMAFTMLAGRLEIYPLLILFSPSVWRVSKRARVREHHGKN